MEKKLIKNYFFKLITLMLCIIISITALLYGVIKLWIEYKNNEVRIILPIIGLTILLFFFVLSLIGIIPFLKDLRSVLTKTFLNITAIVVGFNKKEYGGEPPTTVYYPIFNTLDTNKEIELDVTGAEINKVYRVVYLKHTKIAKIVEVNN